MMNQDDYDLVTMSKRQWREERAKYAKTYRDAAVELRKALQLVHDFYTADTQTFVGRHGHNVGSKQAHDAARKVLRDTEWLKVE